MTLEERRRETQWVLEAQAGDLASLDRLLTAIQGPLFGYLLQILRRRELAEDVLQDVFLKIHRKLEWLEQPEYFRTWAWRIAGREAVRRAQREKRFAGEDGLEKLTAPPRTPDLDIDKLLAAVSPASRAVLALHYLEGLPLDEAARVLGLKTGTAKSRLAYGLAVLRKLLAPAQVRR